MNINDFLNIRDSKTPEEFEEWFDDIASWYIDACGTKIPCAKIARRKAFLRDGTVIEVDDPAKLKMIGDDGYSLTNETVLIHRFSQLNPYHHLEIANHIVELWKMEQEEKNPDKNMECSFCGKKAYEVDKMIEGPNDLYICDECVEMCNTILKKVEE